MLNFKKPRKIGALEKGGGGVRTQDPGVGMGGINKGGLWMVFETKEIEKSYLIFTHQMTDKMTKNR